MRVFKDTFVRDEDMSADITSISIPLTSYYGFAVQALYTGSPNGTLRLQASVDNTNWVDIGDSIVTITSAGTWIWNFIGNFCANMRVAYTASSGSGTLSAIIFAKGV